MCKADRNTDEHNQPEGAKQKVWDNQKLCQPEGAKQRKQAAARNPASLEVQKSEVKRKLAIGYKSPLHSLTFIYQTNISIWIPFNVWSNTKLHMTIYFVKSMYNFQVETLQFFFSYWFCFKIKYLYSSHAFVHAHLSPSRVAKFMDFRLTWS